MGSLESALLEAVDFLEEQDLRYAVIGGLALAQWGVSRATRDVDFKIAVPDTDYERVGSLLRTRFPVAGRPELPPNPLIISVLIDDVLVDFLLAIPGYETSIVERAVTRNTMNRKVAYSSAEDLIVQKIAASRDKDWLDVKSLLVAQRGALDLVYIRDWTRQFAEALERPELVTKLESLL